jgi:plastocyanin
MPRKVLLLFALLVAMVPQAGARAADNTVTLSATSFQPAKLTIHVGDSVTWVLPSSLTTASMHTVTSDDGTSFNQSLSCGLLQCLGGSDTYSLTFLAAGSFPYHCNVVPGMTGVITVVSSTPPSPSPVPPPSPAPSPSASPSPAPSPSASPSPTPSGSSSPGAPASTSSSPLAAQPSSGGGASGPTIVVIVAAVVALICGIGLVILRRAGAW